MSKWRYYIKNFADQPVMPLGERKGRKMSYQKSLKLIIAVILVLSFLVGCGGSTPAVVSETPAATPTPEPATATPTSAVDPQEVGDSERGREIHETGGGVVGVEDEHGCSECHSLDGSVKSFFMDAAPSFQDISKRAGERVPELSAVEYLRQSIVDPSAYMVEGFGDYMPKGFRFLLSEEDVDALVAFLLTQ